MTETFVRPYSELRRLFPSVFLPSITASKEPKPSDIILITFGPTKKEVTWKVLGEIEGSA